MSNETDPKCIFPYSVYWETPISGKPEEATNQNNVARCGDRFRCGKVFRCRHNEVVRDRDNVATCPRGYQRI